MTTCKLLNSKLVISGTKDEIENYLEVEDSLEYYYYSISKDEFVQIDKMAPAHWKNSYLKTFRELIELLEQVSPETLRDWKICLDYTDYANNPVSEKVINKIETINNFTK